MPEPLDPTVGDLLLARRILERLGYSVADGDHRLGWVAEEVCREMDALRADKARLDFLDRCNKRLNDRYGNDYGWKLILNHNVSRLMLDDWSNSVDLHDAEGSHFKQPSCRNAIDEHLRRLDQHRQRDAFHG